MMVGYMKARAGCCKIPARDNAIAPPNVVQDGYVQHGRESAYFLAAPMEDNGEKGWKSGEG